MTTLDNHGDVTRTGGTATVRFVRHLDAAIEAVWEAIATAEGLGIWLADAVVVPAETIDIDFGDGGTVGGQVRVWEPPTTLEYLWAFSGEPDSIIRFELTAQDSGTRLVLDHQLVPGDQAVGYGAGWHAHLDHLESHLAGDDPGDWMELFSSLLPEYTTS